MAELWHGSHTQARRICSETQGVLDDCERAGLCRLMPGIAHLLRDKSLINIEPKATGINAIR
jgi:hypothetical protein